MFDIGALEFLVLAIAALFIFGPDRLPEVARQAARGLKQVRSMAGSARKQFSQELGPEFENLDFKDLNPRSFVRRHVLDGIDEDDVDIRDDLKVDLNGQDGGSYDRDSFDRDAADEWDGDTQASGSSARATEEARPPFDPDAT